MSFESLGQVRNLIVAKINLFLINLQHSILLTINKGYGFVMYTTYLDDPNVDGKLLSVPGIRDRGYVQIGSVSLLVF